MKRREMLVYFSAGWGIAGIARNILTIIFPILAVGMALGNEHNGYLFSLISLCWASMTLISGKLIIKNNIFAVVSVGFFIGAAGLILLSFSGSNIVTLYASMILIGGGCGLICAPSFTVMSKVCTPGNKGISIGIMQSTYTLLGFFAAPVAVTFIAEKSSWQIAVRILALILACYAAIMLLKKQKVEYLKIENDKKEERKIKDLLKYKTIWVCCGALSLAMAWYMVTGSFTIIYLQDVKALNNLQAASLLSAYGIGGFLGEIAVPAISDKLGRKKTITVFMMTALIAYGIFLNLETSNNIILAIVLAISAFSFAGALPIFSTIIPGESVNEDMVEYAVSVTPACGEYLGGTLFPLLAGIATKAFGVNTVMCSLWLIPVLLVIINKVFFKENV